MLQVELSASVRNQFGKGAMRRLRSEGKTPGVLYGQGVEPLPLALDTKTFYKELLYIQRRNAIVTLSLDNGQEHHVLIKDIQSDPVKDTLIHADFQKIDINKAKRFVVGIEYKGTPKGVDMGGVLMIEQNNVVVEGLPLDVPDNFQVDISDLKIGDKILLGSLELPDTINMVSGKERVCVRVDSAAKEKKDAEQEEAEMAEAE